MRLLPKLRKFIYDKITIPITIKSNLQLTEDKKRAGWKAKPPRMNNMDYKFYCLKMRKLEDHHKSDLSKKLAKWDWLKP